MELKTFLYDNLRLCADLLKRNRLYFAVLTLVLLIYVRAALDPLDQTMLFLALMGKATVVGMLILTVVRKYDCSPAAFLRLSLISMFLLLVTGHVFAWLH